MDKNGLAEAKRRRQALARQEQEAGYPPHACIGHTYPLFDCPCPEAHEASGKGEDDNG